MITLNGDYLEGGGQIIRTALSLSIITGKSFKVKSIRSKRDKPGLKEQHLQAVNVVASLCNAKHNAKLSSQELIFEPGKLTESKTISVNIRTAGSTALIISTILPIAYSLKQSLKVEIRGGGTWNIFAPSVLYIQDVLLPLLKKIGLKASINIKRDGFYPKGGAYIELELHPWRGKKVYDLVTHKIKSIKIHSIAAEQLKERKVADRQSQAALNRLSKMFRVTKEIKYVPALNPGSGLLLVTSPTILGSNSNGQRGKSSEQVAEDALNLLQIELKAKSGVDHRAADQLMIYMALVGGGRLKPSRISKHARTNAYVIEKFLPVKFNFDKNYITCSS